jgi:hypothetical protein
MDIHILNFSAELTDHLAVILEKQKIETVKTREKTAEEVARKAAILAQYAHVSSGEEYPLLWWFFFCILRD